ncbi:MAG: prolyl oligopeptidase family serine peptidase [Ignavibacteria bacterium]|nr:prolyl oligopeptidase family serine peptidase [Ignavibacteria bacterium]
MKLNLASIILLTFLNYYVLSQIEFTPPKTKSIQAVDTIFGHIITDHYRWLENKDDPEVKEWSKAQTEYSLDYINKTTKKITGLSEEIRQYLDRDYISPPFFKANREFFYARKKGEQQNKLYTRYKNKTILLFDPLKVDNTGLTAIVGVVLNKKADKAAIGVQTKGNEIAKYYFIDTRTGKEIAPPLEGVFYISWCRDDTYLYVTYRSMEDIRQQRALKTFKHRLGSNTKDDVFLFAPKEAKYFARIWDDENSELTFISEGDFFTNTLKLVNSKKSTDTITIFSSSEFRSNPIFVKDGKIFLETNHESPNNKIMVADIENPEFPNWKVLIPENENPKLGFVVTSDFILVVERKDVITRLFSYDLNGKFLGEVNLPELAQIGNFYFVPDKNQVFVSLISFTSPSKLYSIDGKTLDWKLIFQDTSIIDTKNIEAKQVFYKSKDGTQIPMFIVSRKGTKLDGNNPTLLYGYGGFNIGMQPHYLGVTASFINRGGVYAVACLRGGNEYGENWHKAGMLHNKQNVFDDFIYAGEYLIQQGYTNPSKLAIKGVSNGGLLIGAVVTQRPDLFKAAISSVPLLDMIRYHKFLIARYWVPEYGDPDIESDFKYLISYSPYHNVRVGISLPTMLVRAGENDTRVDPSHAKKFVALLQNCQWQKNPVLLLVDFESGHGSGQSVEQQIKNIEIEWQWLMNQLGMQ